MSKRIIVWFSCGAASAVAAKLAIKKHGHDIVSVVYCDTGGEHPSNMTFLKEAEKWLGTTITILRSEKYQNHFDVYRKTKYLSGIMGARCTVELKKVPRKKYQLPDDIHVMGYTYEEKKRAERFAHNNFELFTEFILIDEKVSKEDCLGVIWKSGLPIPKMYDLKYNHNNCIGCVKGKKGYWNKIRIDFPAHFEEMASIEKEIGYTILRKSNGDPLPLTELDPRAGNYKEEEPIVCGLGCGSVIAGLDIKKEKN